jgi:hypothetical protein
MSEVADITREHTTVEAAGLDDPAQDRKRVQIRNHMVVRQLGGWACDPTDDFEWAHRLEVDRGGSLSPMAVEKCWT